MAEYFFSRLETYRRKTSPADMHRREIVCKHLNEVYKVTKFQDERVFGLVKTEAESRGITITITEFRADKIILRYAYRYLAAEPEEKNKILAEVKQFSSRGPGVRCLVEEGIHTFEELEEKYPRMVAEALVLPTKPATPAGEELKSRLTDLVEVFEATLAENEHLREQNADLTQSLESVASAGQDYLHLLENEVQDQDKRLKEAREALRQSHAHTLAKIAQEHPEFPLLTTIAQQLHERKPSGPREELLASLPKTYNWPNDSGNINYQDRFLKGLQTLVGEERLQVVKQLQNFASHGPEYAALNTKKSWARLPFSPPECLVSRGADDLRFTWKKNGDVTVFWLYRKSNTRVKQSES